jgi:uncharacterized membrane protein
MLVLLLVLRMIHILGGVFWAGASLLMAFFVEPTVRTSGDDGRRFMQRFAAQSGLTTWMLIASTATVLAGLWLLWIVSDGLQLAFLSTGRGLGLTLGALAAVVGYGVGYFMQNRPIRRMVALGGQIAASGAPPTPAQGAEIQQLTVTVRRGGHITTGLLVVAILLMATARYLPSF